MADLYSEFGCYPSRARLHAREKGKGSYEIRFSPVNGRHVTVPRTTKSRHTVNDILKQAGIKKQF